jgi:hypothetical protein
VIEIDKSCNRNIDPSASHKPGLFVVKRGLGECKSFLSSHAELF